MAENKKRVLVPAGKPEPKDDESYVTPRGMDISIHSDAYGLWYVKVGAGVPAEEISGRYTTRSKAEEAVEKYLKTYWKGRG